MESATGRISAVRGANATVEVLSPLACRRCAAGKGCGAGIFQDATRTREIQIQIPLHMTVSVGDDIELAIASRHLLRAAVLAYALPLAAMLGSLGVFWVLSENASDGQAVVVAIFGLVSGLLLSRRLLKRESICEQFVPVIGAVPDVG